MLIHSLWQVVTVLCCGPAAALWLSSAVTESAQLSRDALPACGCCAVPSGEGSQPKCSAEHSLIPVTGPLGTSQGLAHALALGALS